MGRILAAIIFLLILYLPVVYVFGLMLKELSEEYRKK
jgi:hypothetical protein